MPILTFWVVTPSGASARADLPSRKGLFGVFRTQKRRVEKLSTKCGKLQRRPAPGNGLRRAGRLPRQIAIQRRRARPACKGFEI